MTYEGGTHIEYVMDKVVEAVREHIEKKTKQKIKPSEIKSQFKLILDARIVKPRYSSQTKENLVTPPSMYGSVLTIEPKTVKDLVGSPMMKKIIEWAERRKIVEEMREASEKLEKSRSESFHHIEKYYPATAKDTSKNILFVAEGDSALKPLRAAKKPIHGLFPLRGKPDNVFDKSIKYLADQVEFQNLVKIMGLDLSGKVDVSKLRYGSLVVATDADLDGIHIRGLLVVSFNRFWPELISKGVLKFLKTPVMTATVGKKVIEFFTPDDYEAWLKDNHNTKHSLKYYKGLGSWDTANMDRFMNDPKYIYTVDKMDAEDIEKLNMAFDPQRAADRKLWLKLHY
jgi:DNA topoisomerase-2